MEKNIFLTQNANLNSFAIFEYDYFAINLDLIKAVEKLNLYVALFFSLFKFQRKLLE